ncbi:MAG: DUF1553 domain-containing protein [Fuerstiella sp.]|nr:DUF1553 domain-containing protein [Fuerstiella sp.]
MPFRITFPVAATAALMSFSTASVVADQFSVEPVSAALVGPHERLQMVATEPDAAGGPVDVTRSVTYRNLTPDLITVSTTGVVTPLKSGTAAVRIERGDAAVEVPIEVSGMGGEFPVSFQKDVMPVLSKAGCNQGACHASQYGKGGLKLSLLGYAPEQDYPALVRDLHQRRVSAVRPEDSLVLKKATLETGHGGGMRFRSGSYSYNVVKAWIADGLKQPDAKKDAQVVSLSISPSNRVYLADQTQQLRVVAHYSDNTTRDVTHVARYDSLGENVAGVDKSGHVEIVGHGQAAIMIRFEGQATVAHVLSPHRENVDLTGFAANNFIDENVKAHWRRLGVQPSGLCSDEHFIRRAFIDAIGTLPTPERVNTFLQSKEADKRVQLIDELLGLAGDPARDIYGNEWSAWWTLKWGDLVRINRNTLGDGGMWAFSNWVRNSLRENKPVDQFVRAIITAQGSIYQNGPANYFKTAKTPTDLAETTAQIFLGVRLQCAKCHHHPFEAYSQADYYGLAAFFTRVGTKASTDFGALGADTVVKLNPTGSIRHPRTRQTMAPKPLGDEAGDMADVRDLRRPLSEWITSPDNDLFSRNIVNRVWGHFMAKGIVEPIDDMRATNPPSNPELLEALAQDFVDHGFDLKHLMKSIMTSRVYQLDASPRPENATDDRLYLHYYVKRMPAEALLDGIDFACGTRERFSGVPVGTRAIELPDPNYTSYFLDTLGRPQRVITCECERTAQPNLSQVLHIANGDVVNRKLTDKAGRITQLEKADDQKAIAELYLVTMSRPPTPAEFTQASAVIAGSENRRQGLEDLLWALLNSREFLFIH